MALLTRDQILAAADRSRFVDVSVPEWGEGATVRVGVFSSRDRMSWSQRCANAREAHPDRILPEYQASFIALCVIGEDGQTLFSEADVAALAAKSDAPIERIFDAAWTLNGMGKAGVEEAKKNSAATPTASSSSASASPTDSSPVSSRNGLATAATSPN